MDDIQRRLGARLKSLRVRKGPEHTQAWLAEKLGFSVKYVSEVERGKVNLPLQTLCAFARALGTSASELLVGVDVPLPARKIESLDRLLAGRTPEQQRHALQLLSAVAALMDARPKT